MNSAYLWSFIAANLAIFLTLVLNRQFTGSSVEHLWEGITKKNGIIAAIIPFLAIFLSGALSDIGKARLVFWRWHNPLPGCRAFTELVRTDPRIDLPALMRKHGDFPQDPKAQNAFWYRLYRGHKTARMVWESQKIYLLTSDLTTISAAFAILFSVGAAVASTGWKISLTYTVALAIQYVVAASAARNYGNRFVLNVLSEESYTS
jgi:hypothetical protein